MKQKNEFLLPSEKNNPKVLIRRDAETDITFGCPPEARKIQDLINYGIVNINKPSGPSSHLIADYVKKILNLKKTGHSGTLDPKVTGSLPIALEDATRIVQTLLPAGKEYVALMRIHDAPSEEKIKKTFKKFMGKIKQLPPVRSAVKRRLRSREIYYSEILEIRDNYVLFRVGCEAGTYIRKLIHDMGLDLGSGAHMVQLIRTKAGPFKENKWHTLQDLTDAYEVYKKENNEKPLKKIIEPFENAIKYFPKVWIMDSAVSNICHGAPLATQGISKLTEDVSPNIQVAILTLKGELVGLGTAKKTAKEILGTDEGIAVKTEKIFMRREVYPKQK